LQNGEFFGDFAWPIFFDHFESKWKIFALGLGGAWGGRKRVWAVKKT